MSVYEALQLMLSFAIFVIALLTFVVSLIVFRDKK